MTSKINTFNALNGYFLTSDGTLNLNYLMDSLVLTLDNTRTLYDGMQNTRRKAYSVAWETMIALTNEILSFEFYDQHYVCTSQQLKDYFAKYGMDFKKALAPLVEYIEETRNEM